MRVPIAAAFALLAGGGEEGQVLRVICLGKKNISFESHLEMTFPMDGKEKMFQTTDKNN